jgi:acetyl esterase
MLDLQLKALLDHGKAAGMPDLCDLPPVPCRGFFHQLLVATDAKPVDVHVENHAIAGPGGALGVRIYRPRTAAAPATLRGLVVYLHGGGFVVGHPDDYDGLCRTLCVQTDCVVMQVDYRLAPEHPFPAAIDDCYAAVVWAAAQARSLGADPERLAVVGDSAGGTLTAGVTLLAKRMGGPKIHYQVLIYPMTAPAPERFPSYARCGEGFVITTKTAWYFSRHTFGASGIAPDERGAPLLAKDLAGLPPALVLVAGYDVLRDEGVAYAEALQGAGNHVVLVEYAGLAHGFINMSGALDASRQAVAQVSAALRSALSG